MILRGVAYSSCTVYTSMWALQRLVRWYVWETTATIYPQRQAKKQQQYNNEWEHRSRESGRMKERHGAERGQIMWAWWVGLHMLPYAVPKKANVLADYISSPSILKQGKKRELLNEIRHGLTCKYPYRKLENKIGLWPITSRARHWFMVTIISAESYCS